MKGIITLNIEVDYATMLDPQNQGALYLFTGAKTVEEMVKVHMDSIGEELVTILKAKPLVTYNLDGRLQQDVEQQLDYPVEEELQESQIEEITGVEVEDVDVVREVESPPEQPSFELVEKLGEAIEHVSMELGIPQKIKVNGELMAQLEALSKDDAGEGVIVEYKGFPLEQEGMEEPFIIVYKTYSGSEVKFFS